MHDSSLSDGSRAADAASVRVVRRVARETGRDVVELPPLYDAVDPEALDAVVDSVATTLVKFRYADHDVWIDADGTVSVGSWDR
jgi:hypothetical protein